MIYLLKMVMFHSYVQELEYMKGMYNIHAKLSIETTSEW